MNQIQTNVKEVIQDVIHDKHAKITPFKENPEKDFWLDVDLILHYETMELLERGFSIGGITTHNGKVRLGLHLAKEIEKK